MQWHGNKWALVAVPLCPIFSTFISGVFSEIFNVVRMTRIPLPIITIVSLQQEYSPRVSISRIISTFKYFVFHVAECLSCEIRTTTSFRCAMMVFDVAHEWQCSNALGYPNVTTFLGKSSGCKIICLFVKFWHMDWISTVLVFRVFHHVKHTIFHNPS